MAILLLMLLAVGAALDGAWLACAILGTLAGLLALRVLHECGAAMAAVLRGLNAQETERE